MSIERKARGVVALALLAMSCAEPTEPKTTESHSADAQHEDMRALLAALRERFELRSDALLPRGALRDASMSTPLASEGALALDQVQDRFVPRYDEVDEPLEDVEVSLPVSADEGFEVRRTDTQLGLRVRLLGAEERRGQEAEGFVAYEGAGPNGGTLLQKVTAHGTEDYLTLEGPVDGDEVVYEVELSEEVAGLRLVANTLEFLDAQGTPALRVPSPYLVTADGERVDATLDVTGCEVDRSSAAPWGRATTAPGSATCFMHVGFDGEKLRYPALLDPSWTTTTSMLQNRSMHTATRLNNGRVLVAGGWDPATYSVHGTAEIYDPVTGTWAATGSMPGRHMNAGAVLLSDGLVFVVGGYDEDFQETTRAQTFDPSTGRWTARASLAQARTGPVVALLPKGRVLVAGGSDNGTSALATTAIFDPSATVDSWTPSGSMVEPLADPMGVKIDDSRILLVGTKESGAGAQMYDIDSGTFRPLAAPAGNHVPETLTLLEEGKVLLAGSDVNPSVPQVYDANANLWWKTGATTQRHGGATATRLADGRVLMVGSSLADVDKKTELYNPKWGTWAPMPDLNIGRRLSGHTATLLANGKVLVAGGSVGGARRAELFSSTALPTTISEYRFDPSVDDDILSDRDTEIWASVRRPATLASNVRYPVLLFLHGNHETCGTGTSPRIDDNIEYTNSGTCPSTHVVVPNHAGYDYIADELASRGYIVVSINANRGFGLAGGVDGDDGLILARGRLVLKHLQLLSAWNQGEPTPASLGVSLKDKLDLNQIGMMGHSRGGEGVRAAYELYRDAGSPWPGRINDPRLIFRGIFEIAPTDGHSGSRYLNAKETRWAVLLAACDGDVGVRGVCAFDRMVGMFDEAYPSFKATYTVWGANHNFYNTEWQASDPAACENHAPMFELEPGTPYSAGSGEQRQTGFYSVLSFFLANVGSIRDPRFNAVFDPRFAPVANVRVDRGFTPASLSVFSRRLEDFVNPTGTSSYGLENFHRNLSSVNYQMLTAHHSSTDPAFPTTRGAQIKWTNGSANTYFQTNWKNVGSGFSLSSNGFLDFRIDRNSPSAWNPFAATTLTVQLVNDDDTLSTAIPVERYASLITPLRYRAVLQTVRIPLSAFTGAKLSAVRGARFTFSGTSSGDIYLANIRATFPAIDGATVGLHGNGLSAPVIDPRFPPATTLVQKSAASARASSATNTSAAMPAPVATGTIVAMREKRSSNTVEIVLESTTPFGGRDALLTLHVGAIKSTASAYLSSYLTRVKFRFPKAAIRALSGGEELQVSYGDLDAPGTHWRFGAFDKTKVVVQP